MLYLRSSLQFLLLFHLCSHNLLCFGFFFHLLFLGSSLSFSLILNSLFPFSLFSLLFSSCSLLCLLYQVLFLRLDLCLSFLFFTLTHLNDSFHKLLFLLIDLTLLLLFLAQTRLHCLPHKFLLSSLLSLHHLLGDDWTRFRSSRVLSRVLRGWCWLLMLCHRLTDLLSHGHLQGHFVQLSVPLDHQLLECDEIVDCGYLINDLLV